MSTVIDTHPASGKHKGKTVATLLAVLLGGTGTHRFYLYGVKDFWAWIYLCAFALFVGAVVLTRAPHSLIISLLALFPLSIFAGWVEALTIGLTSDEKWDAKHNPHSARTSASRWPIVLLLVLTFACGFTAVIISMARATDLFLTGGAYG
ncbi:MAG: NINE protein [Pseudomonadota bacterium]